jgi:hypothetical protein
MKNFIFIFAIVLTFCFTASAQFMFTAADGTKISNSAKPDKGKNTPFVRYYSVVGNEIVVHDPYDKDGKIEHVYVTRVTINEIDVKSFEINKSAMGFVLYFKAQMNIIKHSNDEEDGKEISRDDIGLPFETLEAANAFRDKVVAKFTTAQKNDLKEAEFENSLADLDLSLDDKPKGESESNNSSDSDDDSPSSSSTSGNSSSNSSSNNSTPKAKTNVNVTLVNKFKGEIEITIVNKGNSKRETWIAANGRKNFNIDVGGKVLGANGAVLLVITADMDKTDQVIFK